MRYTEQQAREMIVETGLDLLRSGLTEPGEISVPASMTIRS